MGYSGAWVNKRIDHTKLYKIGRRYQVPLGVAIDFMTPYYI